MGSVLLGFLLRKSVPKGVSLYNINKIVRTHARDVRESNDIPTGLRAHYVTLRNSSSSGQARSKASEKKIRFHFRLRLINT